MSQELRPIDDLIYTRLDLPQPPEVDTAALSAWVAEAQRQAIAEDGLYAQNTGQVYPWVTAYALRRNNFDPSFAERFPEIVEYIKNFPTTRWKGISILCQRSDRDVFLHTDPDYGIGWRVYLSHGGPRLYLKKFKERHTERPQTWSNGGPEGMERMCHPERIYAQDVGRFAWAMSAIRAAHGVERNDGAFGDRITMALVPELDYVDQAANEAMLRRGAEKYADTAIWY